MPSLSGGSQNIAEKGSAVSNENESSSKSKKRDFVTVMEDLNEATLDELRVQTNISRNTSIHKIGN